MEKKSAEQIAKFRKLIIGVSIVIPVAVAILFGVKIDGFNFSFLPPIYATINGITAVLLTVALIAIKKKKVLLHQRLIQVCLVLSLLFLLAYVAYHMTSESTTYGGDYKGLYYTILISHIALSVIVIPFVLFTYLHAYSANFDKHRKLAKIAFPIWLYVAITGVVVYVMIAPFYA